MEQENQQEDNTQTTEQLEQEQVKWNKLFQHFIENLLQGENDSSRLSVSIVPLAVPSLLKVLHQMVEISRISTTSSSSSSTHTTLTDVDHLFALGESLGNYLSKQLDPACFEMLTHEVNRATFYWLHNFLRFSPSIKGYYRATKQRARLLLARLALVRHYPTAPTEGFHAYRDITPLIFASRNLYWLEELRFELGLPLKSIVIFRDASHLCSLLEEFSQSSTYKPFMLILYTGGWKDDFECDDIPNLVGIADKYRMWCHIEGGGLIGLAASKGLIPRNIRRAILRADSILLNPMNFFGYVDENKMIPTVFYRKEKSSPYKDTELLATTEQSSSSSAVSGSSHPSAMSPQLDRPNHSHPSPPLIMRPVDHGILTLQLWFVLQFIGQEKLKSKVDKVLSLCSSLHTKLASIPSISVFTSPDSAKVVFQYVPLKCEYEADNQPLFLQELQSPVFVQKVNQQIFNDLVNSTSAIELDLSLVATQFSRGGSISPNPAIITTTNTTAPISLDTGHIDDHILFSPLFSQNLEAMDESLIETFISNLGLEIQLIDGTLCQKEAFQKLVWSHANQGLHSVSVNNFVGLGAVRYIPPLLLTGRPAVKASPESPPPPPLTFGKKLQEEIDRLNETIASKLSTSKEKSIYQAGKDEYQLSCIILGVDTTPMDFERCQLYLDEILATACVVEQEFEFSKQIDKIVESGIKEVEERLRRENERLESEQTIFRKIPVFGSVLNWMMPPPPPTATRGNSFNLLTTTITDPSTTIKKSNIKKPSFEISQPPLSSTVPLPQSMASVLLSTSTPTPVTSTVVEIVREGEVGEELQDPTQPQRVPQVEGTVQLHTQIHIQEQIHPHPQPQHQGTEVQVVPHTQRPEVVQVQGTKVLTQQDQVQPQV